MGFLGKISDTILKKPSGKLWVQLFRYLVSGGIAFVVDAGTLTLLTEFFGSGLLLLWTAISFGIGLAITYLFSILWVFDNRSMANRNAELLIFALIGISGLGLTELLMWVFAGKCMLHYLIAKIITTVIVFIWNFAAKKLILFRNKKTS